MEPTEGWKEIVILGPEEPVDRIADLFLRYSKTHTSIIVGECDITYRGRAFSKAPWGVRIFIYKADGSLIIHGGRDRDPLNWQPPGSLCIPSVTEGGLEITCSNRKHGHEVVVVRFRRILVSIWSRLSTTGLEIRGTEKDIASAIYSRPDLIAPGATVIGREVDTPSGKIDLLLRDKEGKIYVVEIKNEKAGIAAVNQLERYVEYTGSSIKKVSEGKETIVRGVLVAPGISERAKELLIRKGFLHIDPREFKQAMYSSLTGYMRRKTPKEASGGYIKETKEMTSSPP